MDFFDLKGILNDLLDGYILRMLHSLRVNTPPSTPANAPLIQVDGQQMGVFGELHPKVREAYDWGDTFKYPVLAADLDMDLLLTLIPVLTQTRNVPDFPGDFGRSGFCCG